MSLYRINHGMRETSDEYPLAVTDLCNCLLEDACHGDNSRARVVSTDKMSGHSGAGLTDIQRKTYQFRETVQVSGTSETDCQRT